MSVRHALLLALLLAGAGGPLAAQDWTFTDVTEAAGLDYLHGFARGEPVVPSMFMNGVAAGDVDGDGLVDLFVTPGARVNRLFRNRGDGTFEEVAAAAGVATPPAADGGCAFADLDGDGHLDLWVGGIAARIRIFRNRGDGTFEEVSAAAGLPLFELAGGPAFGDADRDGDLDVFVPQWNMEPAELLWRNDGDFTFSPATAAVLGAEAAAALLFTFTPNFTDLDADGWPDLVVASDFGNSQVLLGNGDGTLRLATDPAVIVDENGMGASVGDFDRDGRLDWFVGSISNAQKIYGNRLYRGRGDGTFEDATGVASVADGDWAWGSCFGDFDLDGWLDLFQVNGWDRERLDATPSRLFMARGDGTFANEAILRGLHRDRRQGRGVVCFDFDLDGDLDLFVTHQDEGPALWRNDGVHTGGHLTVRLRGRAPNSEGIGARLEVRTVSGTLLVHEMRAGSNYMSQNPAIAHFGLGGESAAVLVVRWPGGSRSAVLGPGANRDVVVEEGLIARSDFESGDLSGWSVSPDAASGQARPPTAPRRR